MISYHPKIDGIFTKNVLSEGAYLKPKTSQKNRQNKPYAVVCIHHNTFLSISKIVLRRQLVQRSVEKYAKMF